MFSEKLKKLRKKKRLTQEQLAEQIDVARTTYSSYEQGRREPDNETLIRIADFFNVSLDYLLERTEAPHWTIKEESTELDELLRGNEDLTYNAATITEEDRQALDNMIAGYYWNKEQKNKK